MKLQGCVSCTCLPLNGTSGLCVLPSASPLQLRRTMWRSLQLKLLSRPFTFGHNRSLLYRQALGEIQRESYFVDLDFINIIIISPDLGLLCCSAPTPILSGTLNCDVSGLWGKCAIESTKRTSFFFQEGIVWYDGTYIMCFWERVCVYVHVLTQ